MSARRTAFRRRTGRRTGGGLDGASVAAQFDLFTLEFLRALARGQDAGRATGALMGFVELAGQARTPWKAAIEQSIRRCDQRIADRAGGAEVDRALFDLGRAGLLVMIEALAPDPVAAARAATRSDALHRAVLGFVAACERQAQRENWSYIALLYQRFKPDSPSN